MFRRWKEAALQPGFLSFAVTTTFIFSVYLATLAPNVTLGFSGLFSAGAFYAGVPPPPGYPAWTLIGWVFIKLLPIGNIAWRLGVASAVAASCASGLVAIMVSQFGQTLEDCDHGAREEPTGRKRTRVIAGFIAGTGLGLHGAFWETAVKANPWPLSIFLLTSVLYLLWRWFIDPGSKRLLYLAFFVYGLTVTNSQLLLAFAFGLVIIAVFACPALGSDLSITVGVGQILVIIADASGFWPDFNEYLSTLLPIQLAICIACVGIGGFLAIRQRALFTKWKVTLAASFCFVVGLTLYLYEPIASMTNPPVNWAYPRTVTGFVHLISRGQYERIRLPSDVFAYIGELWIYLRVMSRDFGIHYLVLSLTPFLFWRKIPRRPRLWLLAIALANVSVVLSMIAVTNPSPDRGSVELVETLYSATHIIPALSAGAAVLLLLHRSRRERPSLEAPQTENSNQNAI